MLELGVTPSHVSVAVGEMGEKEEGREMEEEEEEGEEEGSYCIPVSSLVTSIRFSPIFLQDQKFFPRTFIAR